MKRITVKYDLREIAAKSMVDHGLAPDFPPEAMRQASDLHPQPIQRPESSRDLRSLMWCSIDNDDSRDLDQLTYAEQTRDAGTRILVAVADVDELVARETPIDKHAMLNTTSVYTAAGVFPMLPERLSTDLTSLVEGQDRAAIIHRDGHFA